MNFLEVINLNKDDFNSVSDVYDAIGAILNELSNDGTKSDDDINELCNTFYRAVKW